MYIRKYYNENDNSFIVEVRDNSELKEKKTFKDFYSFYNFLKHDLGDADLYDYNGFDDTDILNLDLNGAYIKDRFQVNKKDIKYLRVEELSDYECTLHDESKCEILSESNIPQRYVHEICLDDYFKYAFYYVSDIHLDHKLFKNNESSLSHDEIRQRVKTIVSNFYNTMDRKTCMKSIILIAGDVSHNFEINKIFYQEFVKKFSSNIIVAVIGNHELWCFKDFDISSDILIDYTVEKFKELFGTLGIIFLNNELLVFASRKKHIVSLDEVMNITSETEELIRTARLVILGGTGFSGNNQKYNASLGLYRRAINNIETDRWQSSRFCMLHNAFAHIASDVRTVVLTHNPLVDWADINCYVKGWVYVNGHTQKNYQCRDYCNLIYADNQLGYVSEKYSFKSFLLDSDTDIMRKYEDGIYEITNEEYKSFYLLKNKWIEFNNKKQRKILMMKKKGIYCFFAKDDKNLYLLNGGKISKLNNKNLNFYFDNLDKYTEIATYFFKGYDEALGNISREVISFGGTGAIHGCIVDIDYYNHIYVNPFDMKITPYYALDIREKFVYPNVGSLLHDRRRDLLESYLKKMPIVHNVKGVSVFAAQGEDYCKEGKLVLSTDIYAVSLLFRKFQYLKSNNIIRIWKDEFLTEKIADIQVGKSLKEIFFS